MFARAQAIKKPNGVRSFNGTQKEMMVKQRQVHYHNYFCYNGNKNSFSIKLIFGSFGEIMGDEAWQSDNSLSVSIFLKYDKFAKNLYFEGINHLSADRKRFSLHAKIWMVLGMGDL